MILQRAFTLALSTSGIDLPLDEQNKSNTFCSFSSTLNTENCTDTLYGVIKKTYWCMITIYKTVSHIKLYHDSQTRCLWLNRIWIYDTFWKTPGGWWLPLVTFNFRNGLGTRSIYFKHPNTSYLPTLPMIGIIPIWYIGYVSCYHSLFLHDYSGWFLMSLKSSK